MPSRQAGKAAQAITIMESIMSKKKGIGGHQSANMGTDEWITPKFILNALGAFNLDPCSAKQMPWPTAKKMISLPECGLKADWNGRVWLNPPYGLQTKNWINKLKRHGNGIALIFARTETQNFHDNVWNNADALFFFHGRLTFHKVCGERAKDNSGAPSVLIAYGEKNALALKRLNNKGIPGKFIKLSGPQLDLFDD